jgi:succinyl-diaminopimelate desuccinylase
METKALIKKLIAFPSVTDDKAVVNRCSSYVADYLRKQGLYVKVEKYGGYRIVYAATHRAKKSDVLFNAHIDVVNGEKSQFRPKERSGRLIGRGALDCKGHAAVIMNLLPRLKNRAKVGAVFSSDEETGGLTTRAMVKRGYYGKFNIVLDGNIDRIIIAQKGILSLKLKAKGRACHASTPWRGQNAIDNLIKGYLKVKKLFPMVSEKNSWQKSLSATIVSGGEVSNQVPDSAEMTLNIRFTENTDPKKLFKRIEKKSNLKAELILISPYVDVPEHNHHVRLFYSSMKRRLNPRIRLGRMNGATDMRYFVLKVKSVAITGLKGGGAHAINEWLDLKSVGKMEKALFDFIVKDFQ